MFWGFDAGDDAESVKDSVSRLLSEKYSFGQRKAILRTDQRVHLPTWRALGDLGMLGLGLPQPFGQIEQRDAVGAAFVTMNLAGRSLLLEPYLNAVLMTNTVLARCADETQRALLMPGISDGSALAVLAHSQRAWPDRLQPGFSFRSDAGALVLEGTCEGVTGGADADWIVVPAAAPTAGGPSLFLLKRGCAGMSVTARRNECGMPVGDITLRAAIVQPGDILGELGGAEGVLVDAHEIGLAASCVEALGAMDAVLEQTAQYLQVRKQFGVALASFQSLRHRLVDMWTQVELSRSLAWMAAASATRQGDTDANQRRRLLSSAKAQCSQACRLVGEGAVQLHGGIGMTEELPVSHYFRRLFEIERRFGGRFHHLGFLTRADEAANLP